MNAARAAWAGAIGAVVMTVIMFIARAAGMGVNLELVLGSFFTASVDTGTWILGFVLHVLLGVIFGLVYAWVFERVLHRADWQAGVGVGLVHSVIMGVLLAFVPPLHPIVGETITPHGAFLVNLGVIGVVAFVLLHLIYGGIVGAVYAPVAIERRARAL